MKSFIEIQVELIQMLSTQYLLDFINDFALANKLDELAYLISHRQLNPPIEKEKPRVSYEETKTEWR
jgi:transcriptional regulatory protein LevR